MSSGVRWASGVGRRASGVGRRAREMSWNNTAPGVHQGPHARSARRRPGYPSPGCVPAGPGSVSPGTRDSITAIREKGDTQAINRGPSSALPITFRVVAWRHASANRPTKSRGIRRSVPVQSPMKPIRRAAARGRPRPVQQLGATPAIIRAEPRDPVGHACTRSEPVRQAARRGGAQGDGPIIRRTTLPPQGHTTASLEMADLTVE
jgi:hypothetical protein